MNDALLATLPVEPMGTMDGTVGYIGSKKGFSVTKTSYGLSSYIVNINPTAHGDDASISYWYNFSGNGKQIKGKTINLVIPICYTFNDFKLLQNLRPILSKQPDNGGILLFNPQFYRGAYGDANSVDYANLTSNNNYEDTPRYEIYLTKEDSEFFIGKEFRLIKGISSNDDIHIIPDSIRIDDYNISIVAVPTNDPAIDNLYVGVSYAVTIDCRIKIGTSTKWSSVPRRIRYNIPIIAQYEIDKPYYIGDGNKKIWPKSWTLPFGPQKTDRIHNFSIEGISNDLWNKGVIRGRDITGKFFDQNVKAFFPYDYGCLVDIFWSNHHQQLFSYCVISDHIEYNGMPYIKHYCQKLTFSDSSFYDNGQKSCLRHLNSVIDNISIDGNEFIWTSSSYRNIKYPYTYNTTLHAFSYTSIINSIGALDIVDHTKTSLSTTSDGYTYFSRVSNNNKDMIISKLPIDSSSINTLLKSKVFNTNYTIPISFDDWVHRCIRPNIGLFSISLTSDNLGAFPNLSKDSYIVNKHYINASNNFIDIINYKNIYSNRQKNYFTRYIATDGSGITISNDGDEPFVTQNRLSPINSSGLADSSNIFAYLSNDTRTNGHTIKYIYKNKSKNWVFGSPVVCYWRDPLFGENYWREDVDNNKNDTVDLLINITGCYGIFSADDPITTGSFNSLLTPLAPGSNGGIEIDTTFRNDLSFIYGSNYKGFINTFNNPTRGAYWAILKSRFKVKCDHGGNNILANGSESNGYTDLVNPILWDYNESGYFNCYIPLKLKFPYGDDSGREFTDPNFSMSSVNFSITAINDYDMPFSYKDNLSFDIDPPNVSGTIDSTVYKTIDDISFSMSRDSTKNSINYTTIEEVYSHIHNQDNSDPQQKRLRIYNDYTTSSDIITTSKSVLSRGSSVRLTYIPKLYGVKPSKSGSNIIESTKEVTYCKGHRYSIDNVSLYIGTSGSYGDDVLSEFSYGSKPYQYISTTDDYFNIKAVFDINHENWSLQWPRSNYDETNIYPCISSVYMLAIKKLGYINTLINSKDEFVPVYGDNIETYPNINSYGAGSPQRVYNLISLGGGYSGIYATGIMFDSTQSSLTSQEIILPVYAPGRYRIYLQVKDEFGQNSAWCLTNPTYNYNHPFGGY